jgi:hypothetical protein
MRLSLTGWIKHNVIHPRISDWSLTQTLSQEFSSNSSWSRKLGAQISGWLSLLNNSFRAPASVSVASKGSDAVDVPNMDLFRKVGRHVQLMMNYHDSSATVRHPANVWRETQANVPCLP